MDSINTRQAILRHLPGVRPWTEVQTKAMQEWVKDLSCSFVLRHTAPLGVEGVISAGIVAGFFSIGCVIHPVSIGFTNPLDGLRWANDMTDASLWCAEVAAALEEASILAGVPAKNHNGFSGVGRLPRMMPTLPVRFT